MQITKPQTFKNNAEFAGTKASDKVFFGECSRFAVFAVHTRFDDVMWFVEDAEIPDEDGHSTIIRQEQTFEKAVAGF